MRLDFTTSGDFNNITKWLDSSLKKSPKSALESIGRKAVGALKSATPKGETGQTAAGWDYKVTAERGGAEVSIVNNSHPEASVNIAKILDLGHGTGTGGYVQPRNYIRPALNDTMSTVGDQLAKEMFE